MTTNAPLTHCVLIRKDPTFVAVSGDIRTTDETVQVFRGSKFLSDLLACSRLLVSWDDRKAALDEQQAGSGTRPRLSIIPGCFPIVPSDREPGTGY